MLRLYGWYEAYRVLLIVVCFKREVVKCWEDSLSAKPLYMKLAQRWGSRRLKMKILSDLTILEILILFPIQQCLAEMLVRWKFQLDESLCVWETI